MVISMQKNQAKQQGSMALSWAELSVSTQPPVTSHQSTVLWLLWGHTERCRRFFSSSPRCRKAVLQCSSAVQWSAIYCSAVQCNLLQCSAIYCSVVQYTTLHCPISQLISSANISSVRTRGKWRPFGAQLLSLKNWLTSYTSTELVTSPISAIVVMFCNGYFV